MAWYYFICNHGPGHQSTEDGWREYPDALTEEDVGGNLQDEQADKDFPSIYFWKVKNPPAKFISDEIQNLKWMRMVQLLQL